MTRKNREVADRQKSLLPASPQTSFTLAGVRTMYEGMGGKEFHCTISGYCRTQVFEFPKIDFRPNGDEPYHTIYTSPSVQAYVASHLVDYFTNSACSNHYTINPSLRHMVGETEANIRSQSKDRTPVFVVIEESSQLTPVEMTKDECNILEEALVQNGEIVPVLVGGREGKKFIVAWATTNGAWPELPNNRPLVNMILAGVRAGQQTSGPIHKYVDDSCLITDDGRFVMMIRPTLSGRGSVATPMDTSEFRDRVSEIRGAVAAMEQDVSAPHMSLLFDAMYSDDFKDDSYQRLQYLRLWQSLVEAGKKFLSYQGNIRTDTAVVAGNKTLSELKDYRHDIAHWWTDTIDGNFLADLRRTTNELIRLKYFCSRDQTSGGPVEAVLDPVRQRPG